MQRNRGARAVRQLLAGGWEEPLAILRALFEVEEDARVPPGRSRMPPGEPARVGEGKPSLRRAGSILADPGRPRVQPPQPLRFRPVASEMTLVKYRREHLRCAVCGRDGASPHHLVPRSVLRWDVPENLLALCDRDHMPTSKVGFHFLGARRWYRLNWRALSVYERRRVMIVLFVIKPWIVRGGREGPSIVTRYKE